MKRSQMQVSGFFTTLVLTSFVVGGAGQSNLSPPNGTDQTGNPNTTIVGAELEPRAPLALSPNTSANLVEVVKLVQAGMDESVILAYIGRCPTAFEPTADEILYLNDLGVSTQVMSALIRHGEALPNEQDGISVANNTDPRAANQPATTVAASPYVAQPTEVSASAAPVVVQQTQPTVVVTTPPVLPAPVNVFYNDLAPYGSWIQLEDYGWCWQPTTVVVNPSWRPYADRGRWLDTDCGWYWQSDYSWGWAPFHYGRWLSHARRGWVWMPDTVWGPSWVSWRNTDTYCGWAPLPPRAHYVPHYGFSFGGRLVGNDFDFGLSVGCFSFISWQHFNDHNPHRYYVPHSETTAIYSHSKVVNNYVIGSNNTIINNGVSRDRLAAYQPTRQHPISVRDLSSQAGTRLRPDRVEKSGQSLVIYRPQLSAGRPPSPALKSPRSDSPPMRAPMPPAGGRAPATPSRNSDLLAGRVAPTRSTIESPGRNSMANPAASRSAASDNSRPIRSQSLAAPATTPFSRPALASPPAASSTTVRVDSFARTTASNPQRQAAISHSTSQELVSGRSLGNSSKPNEANRGSVAAPSPVSTWQTVAQPTTPPTPLRNEPARSGSSSSSRTALRTDSRAPAIAAPQRITASPTQPFSTQRSSASGWTPSAMSTPAPRQPMVAPSSRPTPSYSSPSRQPSVAPSMAPARSMPTPVIRSEPPSRAPMSAPSVSRSPSSAPSRAPSSSDGSASRQSSNDSRRDSSSRRH
jgi:hypothetical protein